MTDEPFYAPFRKPPAPREPKPGEPLWSFTKDMTTWACELRDHGKDIGVEAQILCDGELFYGQRFLLRDQAVAWAAERRHAIERGWER